MTDMPETDLVTIAEREVIEAARVYAAAWLTYMNGALESHVPLRIIENLIAAVSLLESREADLKAIQPCTQTVK